MEVLRGDGNAFRLVLTWPPFWWDRLPVQASCSLGPCTRPCRCCWSLPCQSAPSGPTEAASLDRCPPEVGEVRVKSESHRISVFFSSSSSSPPYGRWPFHRSEWPCPMGRTWSDQPKSEVRLLWRWHHWPCGWRWRSTVQRRKVSWSRDTQFSKHEVK